MSEWVTVARTRTCPTAGWPADECTHAGCSLADDGELERDSVTCQCHGSVFDLSTGEAIGPPAREPVSVYRVRVEDDEIQVARPAG